MTTVTVKAASLKSLLGLFAIDSPLTQLQLGDTWHPSAGFLDETIVGPCPMVRDIVENQYDFIGLGSAFPVHHQ